MKHSYILDSKRNNRPQKPKSLHYTIPVIISQATPEEVKNAILNVMAMTPFEQISIPVNAYRAHIEANVHEKDTRVLSVGNLKSYNKDTGMAEVVVFPSKHQEAVDSFIKKGLGISYSTDNHTGEFLRIDQLIIVPLSEDEDDTPFGEPDDEDDNINPEDFQPLDPN